ncbi:hypothetical protein SCARD494_00061 [Seiridium cardinale]
MDNYTVSTSWVAPGNALLNFSSANCDEGAAWAGAAVKGLTTEDLRNSIPLGLTISYLRTLVPHDWMNATDTDLLAWYTEVLTSPGNTQGNSTLRYILSLPLQKCGQAICSKVGWEGDPDVSGEGMIISYYLAAGLSTVYFAILVWTIVGRYNFGWTEHKITKRAVSAIQESSNTFLDAALVFAVAMLGAAAVRFYGLMTDPNEERSTYATIGSVSMSAFSLFPALILQAVTDGQRTHILRQVLWFAAISLTIAVEIMYRKTYYDLEGLPNDPDPSFENASLQRAWVEHCESFSLRKQLEWGLTTAHDILGLNCLWWLYYFIVTILPQRWHEQKGKTDVGQFFAYCRRWTRALDGLVCIAIMWALLVLFEKYRHSIQVYTGHSDADSEWTFGQVLALATWAPVFVDLVGIGIYGPEKGLDKKVSEKYRIVPAEQGQTKSLEKKSYGSLSNSDIFDNLRRCDEVDEPAQYFRNPTGQVKEREAWENHRECETIDGYTGFCALAKELWSLSVQSESVETKSTTGHVNVSGRKDAGDQECIGDHNTNSNDSRNRGIVTPVWKNQYRGRNFERDKKSFVDEKVLAGREAEGLIDPFARHSDKSARRRLKDSHLSYAVIDKAHDRGIDSIREEQTTRASGNEAVGDAYERCRTNGPTDGNELNLSIAKVTLQLIVAF